MFHSNVSAVSCRQRFCTVEFT